MVKQGKQGVIGALRKGGCRMTKKSKRSRSIIPRRSLIKELQQGVEDIEEYKKGKITLRTHSFENKPQPKIDAKLIRNTREQLNLSRAVFAMRLRVQLRTLEKWEQGTTIPNDQAAALILMVRKYPDTLNRLADI